MNKVIDYIATKTGIIKLWTKAPGAFKDLIFYLSINILLAPSSFNYVYYRIKRLKSSAPAVRDIVCDNMDPCRNAMSNNHLLVLENFKQAGCDVFKTDKKNNKICVLANDRGNFLDCLNNLKNKNSIFIKFNTRIGPSESSRLIYIPHICLKELINLSDSFQIYQKYVSKTGRALYEESISCEVELWLNDEMHYADNNRLPDKPRSKIASREWLTDNKLFIHDIEQYSTWLSESPPYDFPIDLVYTWVDDNDAEWKKNLLHARQNLKEETKLPTSDTADRFRNRDELKYSLRSVNMYADFFRKIYIVTAGQIPEWLNTDHTKIEMVFHDQIIPEEYLPTFNSHAIESRLHQIPGLSEHFIYFNDDFFIGRTVKPEKFYSNILNSYVFYSESEFIGLNEPDTRDFTDEIAAKNNRDLILRKFNKVITQKFLHVPYPLQKSVLNEIEEEFNKELESTTGNKFRSINDISLVSSLYQHYALMKSRAISGSIEHRFIDINRPNLQDLLYSVLYANENNRPDTFCINENADVTDLEKKNRMISAFLEEYFPYKSEYEK